MEKDYIPEFTALTVRTAENLRAELARRRYPQRQLARRLGVTPQWLGRRVNAQVSPNLDDLAQISEALGVSVTELLRESA